MAAPVLVGPRVTLRAVRPSDVQARRRQGWHAGIERGYGVARETGEATEADAEEWLGWTAAQDPDTFWAIDVDGDLAGTAHLYGLRERRARYAIGMLSPAFLGRGLGTETTLLVLAHGFGALDLHRVDLRVLAFNHAARACYRRCGFVEEGIERETCWLDGRWHDDVMMAVLDREFAGLRPA